MAMTTTFRLFRSSLMTPSPTASPHRRQGRCRPDRAGRQGAAGYSEVADDLAAAAGGQRQQSLELDSATDDADAAVAEPGVHEMVRGSRAGQAAVAAAVDVGTVVVELAV